MLKKLFRWFKKDDIKEVIIPRAAHKISREDISNNALKVLYRLNRAGFKAFLVGGCIRDLLLGRNPKDFDIATNALPEEIQELFGNCRVIGRRFKLVHVHFGREIIEVATFRSHHAASAVKNEHGMILHDNVYGSIEEDVLRRDFTVNALYYNIADFSVVDFVSGMHDLTKRQLTLIGDPVARYREDPVRMLRAVRFAAKLGFNISPASARPIHELAHLLKNIPAARLFEEYSKLFLTGHAYDTYKMLCEYGLFKELFPRAADVSKTDLLVNNALHNTDARIAAGKSISPSFLLAVFSWQPMLELAKMKIEDGESEYLARHDAIDQILSEQQRIMAVPRRFVSMVRDIWEMQPRLENRKSARQVAAVFAIAKFRAAYDFLLLRAESGETTAEEGAKWWRTYVEADEATREKLGTSVKSSKRSRKGSKAKNHEKT